MGVSLLSMAWWGIVLTSIGSVIGAFLLVWGGVVLYSIIKNKMSNTLEQFIEKAKEVHRR